MDDYRKQYEKYLKEQRRKNRPARSVCLLIGTILGLIYDGYLIYNFGGGFLEAQDDWQVLGSAFAAYLVGPHIILTWAAALCGLVGWIARNRWLALVSGILYLVAGLAFPMYFLLVVLQGILSFVAFALMGRSQSSTTSYYSTSGKRSKVPVVVAVSLVLAIGLGALGVYYISQQGGEVEISLPGAEETPVEPIELTPGEYTVGEHIPAGRYLITTTEDWCSISFGCTFRTLDKDGDGYTCTLEDGEEFDCSEPVTLTPTK